MKWSEKLFGLLLAHEWIAWGTKSLDPEERREGWDLAKRTAQRVAIALIAALGLGAGGMYAWLAVSSNVAGVTPVGIESGETTIQVVAKEPGVAFDVVLFCNAPDVVIGRSAMTDAPNGGVRYIATRGTESVNWADSPEGQNPSAVYYVTQPNGTQTGLPVEVTKPAADCLKKKAK